MDGLFNDGLMGEIGEWGDTWQEPARTMVSFNRWKFTFFIYVLSSSRRLSKALGNVYATYRIPFSGDTVKRAYVICQLMLIDFWRELLLEL